MDFDGHQKEGHRGFTLPRWGKRHESRGFSSDEFFISRLLPFAVAVAVENAGFLLPEVFPAAALQRPTNDGPRGPSDLTE